MTTANQVPGRMKAVRLARLAVVAAVVCVGSFATASRAQQALAAQTGTAASSETQSVAPPKTDASSTPNASLSPEQQRQAQLKADTDRLFQLAQELKAEVAKSDRNTLSIAVVKKADEIEKLAKSVRERLRAQ